MKLSERIQEYLEQPIAKWNGYKDLLDWWGILADVESGELQIAPGVVQSRFWTEPVAMTDDMGGMDHPFYDAHAGQNEIIGTYRGKPCLWLAGEGGFQAALFLIAGGLPDDLEYVAER